LNLIAVMISSGSVSLSGSGSGSKWEAQSATDPDPDTDTDTDTDTDFNFDTVKPPRWTQNDLREPVLRSEAKDHFSPMPDWKEILRFAQDDAQTEFFDTPVRGNPSLRFRAARNGCSMTECN